MPFSRRARLGLATVALATISAPFVALGAVNLFLQVGLTGLIDRHPERLDIHYSWAWMLIPGHVHIHGLVMTGTGPTDRWRLSADEVEGAIALRPLYDKELTATDVRGRGVEFTYGPRDDPEPGPRVAIDRPWTVSITGVSLDDVRDITYGDYHLRGEAHVPDAGVLIDGPLMSLDGTLAMADMSATHLDDPLAQAIHGEIGASVRGLDRKANLGRGFFDSLSASAAFDADVVSLDFLDYYLAKATWLELNGAGHLHADVRNDRGQMLPGSVVTIDAPKVVVGFLGGEVEGECAIKLDLSDDALAPGSRLAVGFSQYAVRSAGAAASLVEGEGFTVTATTPDVDFREPFTSLDVVLAIPSSVVPSFAPYDALLPAGVGLEVTGGTGLVHGTVHASTADDVVDGDLFLTGSGIQVHIGDVTMTSSLEAHARLKRGEIDAGTYDITGTSFALEDVSIRTPNQPDGGVVGWTASMNVEEGRVNVGAETFFDAHLRLKCRDSTPFLTMFAEKRALPGLARQLLTINDVDGTAHVRLRTQEIDIDTAAFHGKTYEILMHLRRAHAQNYGSLFARLGPLSVGVGVDGAEKHIQLVGAREWYEEGPQPDDFKSVRARVDSDRKAARRERRQEK
jgi:hypothetical protein